MKLNISIVAACLLSLLVNGRETPQPVLVSVVADRGAGPIARYALGKVKAALLEKHVRIEEAASLASSHGQFVIVAGIQPGGPALQLAIAARVTIPSTAESLVVRHERWKDKPALLVSGADERGLMYGLLDVARRISWAPSAVRPFSEVRDSSESPAVRDRGLTIFTMQQAQFENRLHDERYWARYFDMLAENRFNTFQILFAYEMDGYMCPAYPYFVDVEQFPGISVTGLSREQQQRNRDDLKRLMRMAHARGLKITIGLWCHYNRFSRTFKAANHSTPEKGKVFGLTEENLIPYTQAAAAKFLQTFPEIDNIMLLMHGESGIKAEDMRTFWAAIFPVLKKYGPNIQYEMRAKGVPDDLIEAALKLGLKVRMNTKYWAEQVGLPFHPTHIQGLNQFERRHGYSDMLKYPHEYELHWTLWTSGAPRVLLWADPEYVRRFAGTLHLGDTNGFDVMEPEATKMAGHRHDMPPFDLLTPEYRYYDYEFERYWHFFQVFGRLTYNPQASPEIWDTEFRRRFGAAAPYVDQGIHRASEILPRITAYCLPPNHFPTTRGWPERQRQEDVPVYSKAEPSDIEQFSSFDRSAENLLNGSESASIDPVATSRWFAKTSADVLRLANRAEAAAGTNVNKELLSNLVDMRILAYLALYHSRRIPAGESYALFRKTGDLNALNEAISAEKSAIEAWSEIVKAAGNTYNFDLMFGLPQFDLSGHWRDELVKLNHGLTALEAERAKFHPEPTRVVGNYDLGLGQPVPGFERLRRGRASAFEQNGTNLVSLPVPDGRYRVTVDIHDDSANPKTHGPMWIEANGFDYTGRFQVAPGERLQRTFETTSAAGKLEILFDSDTSADWYANTLTVARVDPSIAHVPVRRSEPDRDILIRATVAGVDPIAKVDLIYGNDQKGYSTLEMKRAAPLLYEGSLPAASAREGLKYYIEARDHRERTATWPENGRSNPIAVTVTDDSQAPELSATPVSSAHARTPLRIAADVHDPSGVKWVHLRYRGVTQHQEFRSIRMLPVGGDRYEATIPAAQMDPRFDLMYLFEVMDNKGNGRIYPDLEKETPYNVVKVDRGAGAGTMASR